MAEVCLEGTQMLQTTLSLTLTTPPTRSSTCAEILFLEFSRKVPDLNKFSANVKHSSQNLCGFSPETLYQMMLLWRQLWGDSLLERKDMKKLFFQGDENKQPSLGEACENQTDRMRSASIKWSLTSCRRLNFPFLAFFYLETSLYDKSITKILSIQLLSQSLFFCFVSEYRSASVWALPPSVCVDRVSGDNRHLLLYMFRCTVVPILSRAKLTD